RVLFRSAIVDIRDSQREDSFHAASSEVLRTHANQTGNTLGRVMAARFTFMEICDGTGITSQVKLDALFLQSPTGGPESTVTHVVQVMTLAPWILDHATQRRDNNESEEHCCSAQKSLHGLTTSKRGSLPGVIQQSSKRTTINLIRRSIMTTLYRNFLRHELLHELNNCDTKTNNRNAGGQ